MVALTVKEQSKLIILEEADKRHEHQPFPTFADRTVAESKLHQDLTPVIPSRKIIAKSPEIDEDLYNHYNTHILKILVEKNKY